MSDARGVCRMMVIKGRAGLSEPADKSVHDKSRSYHRSPCGERFRWRVLFHSALHAVLNAVIHSVIYSELFFLYDSDAPPLF